MNKIAFRKPRGYVTRAASILLILCSAGLSISAAKTKSAKTHAGGRLAWPTAAPYDAAILNFDAALTKAAHEPAFRSQLTKSPDSAKAAVAQLGNFNIPIDRIIVFYEPQSAPGANPTPSPNASPMGAMAMNAATMNWASRSNENIHVFVLPPADTDKTKEYHYEDYMMCCYPVWKLSKPRLH